MIQLPDFKTAKERDQYFLENAEMFTVIRRLSPYSVDRHECKGYLEATRLADKLTKDTGRIYMIYAVIGPYDSFCEATHVRRFDGKDKPTDILTSNRSSSESC
jgi:hypothetical protein